MPAYNAEKYLSQAVDSVISQTYNNWELIIINDGSTDSTQNIAGHYAKTYKGIKLINQENKRLSAARNTGIKAANGEWIAFLDADDIWVENKLALQMEKINADANIGLIFSDGYIFNDNHLNTDLLHGAASGLFSGPDMYELLYTGNYIPVLSVLVKKQHLTDIGWQDEQFTGCQDWDYWIRLAANNIVFFGMPDKLFYYRRHSANMSNNNDMIAFEKAVVFIKNFKKELFNTEELQNMKRFLNITICKLVARGEIKEALLLTGKQNKVFKTGVRNTAHFLIGALKRNAYYLLRLVFKTETLVA